MHPHTQCALIKHSSRHYLQHHPTVPPTQPTYVDPLHQALVRLSFPLPKNDTSTLHAHKYKHRVTCYHRQAFSHPQIRAPPTNPSFPQLMCSPPSLTYHSVPPTSPPTPHPSLIPPSSHSSPPTSPPTLTSLSPSLPHLAGLYVVWLSCVLALLHGGEDAVEQSMALPLTHLSSSFTLPAT